MTSVINFIGSAILASLIFASIFGLTHNLNQSNYEKNFELTTQTNAVFLARLMEYDFVKIGFHYPRPAVAIIAADSQSITFKADLLDSGTVNTVSYAIGPVSDLANTKNPRDRYLYRTLDGVTTSANLGLTRLQFIYYDNDGHVTSNLSLIKSMNVQFTIESPERV